MALVLTSANWLDPAQSETFRSISMPDDVVGIASLNRPPAAVRDAAKKRGNAAHSKGSATV